jgi:hypothetical protein
MPSRSLDKVYCDYCKRETSEDYNLSWHHNGWGNDSRDSYEYRDICPECLLRFLKEAAGDLKYEEDTGEVTSIPISHIIKLIEKLESEGK